MSRVLVAAVCFLALQNVKTPTASAHELSKSRKIGQEILMREGITTAPQNNLKDPTDLPTLISVRFLLYQIQGVDGTQGVFTVTGQFLLEWEDPDLVWNETSVSSIEMPPGRIWTPTIFIKNSAAAFMDPTWARFPVVVSRNGMVKWKPGGSISTSCELDLKDFPKDANTCYIDITVAPADIHLVNMSHEIDTTDFFESSEFDLEEKRVDRLPVDERLSRDERENQRKRSLRFAIKIRRQPWFFLMFLFIPTAVLSIMMVMVFLVPEEKVTLCVTVMLAFAVYILLVSETMPQVSADIPFVFYYLVVGILVTVVGLFCTAIVLRTHQQEPASRLSLKYRKIIKVLKRAMCYRCCDKNARETKRRKLNNDNQQRKSKAKPEDATPYEPSSLVGDVLTGQHPYNGYPGGISAGLNRRTGAITSLYVADPDWNTHYDNAPVLAAAQDINNQQALCICDTLEKKTTELTADDWRNERAHAAKILDLFFFTIFFVVIMIDFVGNYLILKIVDKKI